jgi:hypothetical protein
MKVKKRCRFGHLYQAGKQYSRSMEKREQDSDYKSVRESAIHCKKEDINPGDLVSASHIRNYIKELDT